MTQVLLIPILLVAIMANPRETARKARAVRDIAQKTRSARQRAIESYAKNIIDNPELEKNIAPESLEGKQLARLASRSRWGKGPQEWEDRWGEKYWYKNKKGTGQ